MLNAFLDTANEFESFWGVLTNLFESYFAHSRYFTSLAHSILYSMTRKIKVSSNMSIHSRD